MPNASKIFIRPVFIFRMSSIGDVVIAARTVENFFQNGYFPIFVSSLQLKDVLVKIKHLNFFICFDDNFTPHCYVNGNEVAINVFEMELKTFEFRFDSVFCDFQQTSRSRRARKKIHEIILKNKKILIYKVKKRTLYRLLLVMIAALSLNQKKRRASVRKIERIHEKQLDVVNKIFANDGKQNVCINQNIYLNQGQNNFSEKYICLFPGAQHLTKRWPQEHFQTLINLILKNTNYSVYICGGEQEKDLHFSESTTRSPRVHNVIGKHLLTETLHLISCAKYVVSNDSFAGHVADAYHVPATVIFGGTTPEFGFVPLSPTIKIKYLNLSCSPCSRHGREQCRFGNRLCLKNIHPIEIFKDFDLIRDE